MKNKLLLLVLPVTALLGGCVVAPAGPAQPYYAQGNSPYLSGNELDMGSPVYIAAYPNFTFYHRYDPGCDCVRIVRSVESGGAVYWLDHSGQRIHEGHWAPTKPSPRALYGYREWSQQHRNEYHREPPGNRYNNAPAQREMHPQHEERTPPPETNRRREERFASPAPQVERPAPRIENRIENRVENRAENRVERPAPKPEKAPLQAFKEAQSQRSAREAPAMNNSRPEREKPKDAENRKKCPEGKKDC